MDNRIYKFRARNANVPRCWIYGYFVIECGKYFIINEDGKFPVIAGSECQFTGLLDKNKVEIYEGDPVSRKGEYSLVKTKHIVKFHNGMFGIDVEVIDSTTGYTFAPLWQFTVNNEIEVIYEKEKNAKK